MRRILSNELYSSNTQLMKVLKMNKISHYHIGTRSEIKEELLDDLQKMKKNYTFRDDKKYKLLHEENEKFQKDYSNAKKYMKNKTSKETFKGLIKMYLRKGYKIPDLSTKHNLFSLCPLIEENTDKIIRGFTFNQKLSFKTVTYLHKLNVLINKKLHINSNNNEMRFYHSQTSCLPLVTAFDAEESEENLLESIASLLQLINSKVLDKIDSLYVEKPNTSRNSTKIPTFDFSNFRCSSIIPKTPNRKLNSFFVSNSPALSKSRNSTIRGTSRSRRQSFKEPTGIFNSTISTNFRSTTKSSCYGFNSGFCISLENKYNNIDDLVQFAYEKSKKNDYYSVINALKVLLKKFKGYKEEDVENKITQCKETVDSHNIMKSIDKTKKIIMNKEIDKKSKSIYLNSKVLKRIKPLLKTMEDKDQTIQKMDKKLVHRLLTK